MTGPAPEAVPGRLVGRVTALDSFHRWRRGEGYDAGLTTEEYVARMIDPDFDNPAMAKGRALHKALELAKAGDYETLEADGFTFHFDDDCEIALPEVRELRCGMDYGPLYVSGQVDVLDGLRVEDHKSTGFFQPETYLDGYQWRYYLDIFEADVFQWNAFPLKPWKERGREVPDHWLVMPVQIIQQRRYPGLHEDCARLAADYYDFRVKFIEPAKRLAIVAGKVPAATIT